MVEASRTNALPTATPAAFREFLRQEHHPDSLAELWDAVYAPLARWIASRNRSDRPMVVGVNGSQGSGKSTLCSVLAWVLGEYADMHVVVVSIDDLYYTRAERARLAAEVHPLLSTRGVPGTHDVALGITTLAALVEQRLPVSIPRFNKSEDDRASPDDWSQITRPVDVVLFEGWCIGTPPQEPSALEAPVNELEAVADMDGQWRRYVNDRLVHDYPALWQFLDHLIFLQAPEFACVEAWRWKQEQRLATTRPGSKVMSRDEVRQFVAYYQRLTQHNLATLPSCSDVVVQLDPQQQISKVSWQ